MFFFLNLHYEKYKSRIGYRLFHFSEICLLTFYISKNKYTLSFCLELNLKKMFQSPEVTFLKGLSEQMTDSVPDSLLQLKLSEVRK